MGPAGCSVFVKAMRRTLTSSLVRLYLLLCAATAALSIVPRTSKSKVVAAANGREGWSAAQYAHAALLIINSKHNCVAKQQMQLQLGRHLTDDVGEQASAGARTLQALIQADLLSLRPYSEWAQDVPPEAFAASDDGTAVTAPGAVELHNMRTMRAKFEDILAVWQQERKVGATWSCLEHNQADSTHSYRAW